MEPFTSSSTTQTLSSDGSRPILTSRFSSYSTLASDPPSKHVSLAGPTIPAGESLEDLVQAVDAAIDQVGLINSSDAPPPTVIEPPRDRDAVKKVAGRTGSRSPALERVDEGEVLRSPPPTPMSELLPPSVNHSRPSSFSSDSFPGDSIDLTSPAKTRPVSGTGTASMAGVGSGMARSPRADAQFDAIMEEDRRVHSPERNSSSTAIPPSLPIIPANPKRLSTGSSVSAGLPAPRSPSILSNSRFSFQKKRSGWPGTPEAGDENTPVRPRKPRRMGQLPDAMFCKDVQKCKTPLERLRGYAQKMKELSVEEDTGLGDWVDWVKSGGSRSNQRDASPAMLDPSSSSSDRGARKLGRSPSTGGARFNPQPRNVSHGSEASEVTFAVRPDAYTATDLSSRKIGGSPPRGPPSNIPYPGLAHGIGVRPSETVRSFGTQLNAGPMGPPGMPTHSNSMRSLKNSPSPKVPGTGFFASIGRKASMRKAERPTLAQLAPNANGNYSGPKPGGIGLSNLTSRPSQVSLGGSPVVARSQTTNLVHSPTVIGGPRPPPGKPARANSLSTTLGRKSGGGDGQDMLGSPLTESTISEADDSLTVTDEQSSFDHDTEAGTTAADMMSLHSAPTHSTSSPRSMVGANLLARTSLSYRGVSPRSGSVDPVTLFNNSLDKLADVLPHVERRTLALYLRRADGEDIRAIGAYLEDERKGSVMGR